jgi:ATP-binding cassette, subfamily B, bacterial
MAAVMRGLEAEAYDREYSDRELVSRLGGYFGVSRGKVVIVVISVFVLAAAGAALPLVIARGVGVLADGGDPAIVPLLIGAVFLIGFLNWSVNWLRRRLTAEVIADVVLAMRQDAFASAAEQDLSFYDEHSTGRIVSRISSDTEELAQVITLSTDVVNQLFTALILVGVLITIEWRLTLAVLIMSPLVAAAALAFRRLARRVTRQSSRVMGEVNKAIQEAVTGISVAKNFRQEATIYNEFLAINERSYQINVRRGFVLANIFPTLNVLSGIGTALLVFFGGRAAVAGVIGIGAWYLFISGVDRFWFPLINVSAFWSQFQAGLSAAERTFALIDAVPALQQAHGAFVERIQGRIRFEDVFFSYSKQEQVLSGFSLDIAPGESVALVGHTGAGKSSIIKLIARFYEFQQGRILIDGLDIRSLDLRSYRNQLGIVSQVPFLFSASVAENIRYGRPGVSEAEIAAMARRIGDGEWLETLPQGLDSQVGERGSRLSMGQRQLVALTRVLIQGPRIFILDEATASVDPFTELQIQQALDMIMADSTAIIIAHRLSTVRSADRIIVLQNGAIIEQASHDRLMAAGGHYAELYDTYFRHQSLDYVNTAAWRQQNSAPATG